MTVTLGTSTAGDHDGAAAVRSHGRRVVRRAARRVVVVLDRRLHRCSQAHGHLALPAPDAHRAAQPG